MPTNTHHLPGCSVKTLAQLHPGQDKPVHLTDYSWFNVPIVECAEGCPVLERERSERTQIISRRSSTLNP